MSKPHIKLPSGISIPVAEIVDLVKALVEAGVDRKAIPGQVSGVIDAALNFTVLVPGPTGLVLETVDGPVIKAAAAVILSLVPDPVKN